MHGMINSKPYKAHRVIWKMVYGSDPHYIDHINGDRTDNRISNLRSVTKAQNNRNKRLRSDNKSGVTGVHWYNPRNKWRVDVRYNGKTKHIG